MKESAEKGLIKESQQIMGYNVALNQIHNPQLRRTIEKKIDDAYLFGWRETYTVWNDSGGWGDRYSESR